MADVAIGVIGIIVAVASAITSTVLGVQAAEDQAETQEDLAKARLRASEIRARQEQAERAQRAGLVRERARLAREQAVAEAGSTGFTTDLIPEFNLAAAMEERDVFRTMAGGGLEPQLDPTYGPEAGIAAAALGGVNVLARAGLAGADLFGSGGGAVQSPAQAAGSSPQTVLGA